MAETTTEWRPPGPGTWELDPSHAPPAPTRLIRRLHEEAVAPAYRWAFETYGGPLDTIDVRFVHGKMYRRVVPLVGADRSGPPPPAPILWLASRLHPAFRRREKLARRTLAERSFLDVIDSWEGAEREEWVEANLAFDRVEPAELDDSALADHLEAVVDFTARGFYRHHQLHASDLGPIGDLLAHARAWSLDERQVMMALRGRSPATAEAADRLAAIGAALREEGVDPATVAGLDEIRAAGPRSAAALAAYLEQYGSRVVTVYDIEGLTVGELPAATAAMVRRMDGREAGDDAEPERVAAVLREQVPAGSRSAFDRLLTDARRAYGLRDDNGPLTAEWPLGLIRHVYLEAGRRLHGAGRIDDAGLVFELDSPELAALLRGRSGPAGSELAARAEDRAVEAGLEPPRFLGPELPPPDPSPLPPGLRRVTELVMAAVSLLEPEPGERVPLTGTGIGSEPHTGRARVAVRPEDVLTTMVPGDVLVATATAPTYNAVLALAGGVVVQEGGLLSHAAVLARELHIPAVIGAAGAMTLIHDGDVIEVDPVAGVVRIVEAAGG